MKRIILIALCLMCIVGTVSAYGFNLSCPSTIQVGLPIKCSAVGDFPPGTAFDIVLYQTQYTATEISRQAFILQKKDVPQYLLFDTLGLPGGNYKIEVQPKGVSGDEPFRSGSQTLQLIKVLDRSGEITITSPLTQEPENALRVEGSIAKLGNDGVEIEVRGSDGRVFGPQWIETKNEMQTGAGVFTKKVAVPGSGSYEVSFTDAKSYIGEVTFMVTAPPTPSLTVIPTTAIVKTTKTAITTVPTPWPTAAPSPLSPVAVISALGITGLLVTVVMKKR